MEELRNKYSEETNKEWYPNYSNGDYGGFDDGYVEWLEKQVTDSLELKAEIVKRLSLLKRVEISKYKSTPKKETLEYCRSEFGRFVEIGEITKVKKELEEGLPVNYNAFLVDEVECLNEYLLAMKKVNEGRVICEDIDNLLMHSSKLITYVKP